MVKVRLHGEYEEVTEFAKLLERVPTVKVMSRSDGYPDRGKSVYERVYIDAKIVPEPRHWTTLLKVYILRYRICARVS